MKWKIKLIKKSLKYLENIKAKNLAPNSYNSKIQSLNLIMKDKSLLIYQKL